MVQFGIASDRKCAVQGGPIGQGKQERDGGCAGVRRPSPSITGVPLCTGPRRYPPGNRAPDEGSAHHGDQFDSEMLECPHPIPCSTPPCP